MSTNNDCHGYYSITRITVRLVELTRGLDEKLALVNVQIELFLLYALACFKNELLILAIRFCPNWSAVIQSYSTS